MLRHARIGERGGVRVEFVHLMDGLTVVSKFVD